MGVVEVTAECAEGQGWVWSWHGVESCSDGLQHLDFPHRDRKSWHSTCFH